MKTRFLQCTIALFVLNATLHAQVVGDYRSTGSTSLTTTTNWESYNGTSWGAATVAPASNASVNEISIRHAISFGTTQPSNRPNKVTVTSGGVLTGGFDTNTALLIKNTGSIVVLNGGIINLNSHFAMPASTTKNISLLSGATLNVNTGALPHINDTASFWNGNENFESGSTLKIIDLGDYATFVSTLKCQLNTSGYLFGKLIYNDVFSSSPNETFIVKGNLVSGATQITINLCEYFDCRFLSITLLNKIDSSSTKVKVNGDAFVEIMYYTNNNSGATQFEVTGDLYYYYIGDDFILPGIRNNRTVLSGTTLQTITMDNEINHLEINNSGAGVIVSNLSQSHLMLDRLTMTQGNINTNGYSLYQWLPDGLTYTSGYIIGKYIKRNMGAATAVGSNQGLFPMGKLGDPNAHRLIRIDLTTASTRNANLEVRYISTPMGNGGLPISAANSVGFGQVINKSNDDGYWTTRLTDISNSSFSETFQNAIATVSIETNETMPAGMSSVNSITQLRGGWQASGTHSPTTVTNGKIKATRTGIIADDIGQYGFGSNFIVTPLYITNFAGSVLNNISQLNAQVTNVINVQALQLQRSYHTETNSFNTIHTWNNIVAGGYNYTDIINTVTYYRLKIINKDGTIQYSTVIKLNGNNKAKPYYDNVADILKSNSPINWKVYNSTGSLLIQKYNTEIVPTNNLTSGTYIVNCGNGESFKFVK